MSETNTVERPVGQQTPTRYCLRYLCDGYTLADAFRPHPGWGSKGYFVEASQLGEHTDDDVIRAAQETAPPGYWLQHIEAIGGEPHRRDVFKKSVLKGIILSFNAGDKRQNLQINVATCSIKTASTPRKH